jgi:excisionase family DNA binding protein
VSDEPLHLADKLALSLAEAAKAIGVAEGTLRSVLHEIPHLHVGRRVVIPVEPLKEWLATQAKAERGRVDAAVEEILSEILE